LTPFNNKTIKSHRILHSNFRYRTFRSLDTRPLYRIVFTK